MVSWKEASEAEVSAGAFAVEVEVDVEAVGGSSVASPAAAAISLKILSNVVAISGCVKAGRGQSIGLSV